METAFHLRSDLQTQSKISIAIRVLFMVFFLAVTVSGWLRDEMTDFQLYCLMPATMVLLVYELCDDYYRLARERIAVSPAGLEYQSFEYDIFSEWKSLTKIAPDPAWFRRKEECIISESRHVKDKVPFWRLFGMKRINYIPVTRFSRAWRDSDLGRQIKQYAPHLFQ